MESQGHSPVSSAPLDIHSGKPAMLEYLLNCLNFFKVLGYFKGRVGVGKRESENGKMDVGVGKLDMLVSENEHVDVSKRACRPTRASKFRVLQPHGAEPLAASPLPFELGLDLRGCCHLPWEWVISPWYPGAFSRPNGPNVIEPYPFHSFQLFPEGF